MLLNFCEFMILPDKVETNPGIGLFDIRVSDEFVSTARKHQL